MRSGPPKVPNLLPLSRDAWASRTLLVAVLLFFAPLMPTSVHAGAPVSFTDISDSKFYDEIVWLAEHGITKGCGDDRFCPSDTVTRGQMASFLARALNLPAARRDYFVDDAGMNHEYNINRLAAAGITSGCGAGHFCPRGVVARDQMATFLARALGLPAADEAFFTDIDGNKHATSIRRIAAARITTGCGVERYCPQGSVTRGQMAAFLQRALNTRAGPSPGAAPSASASPVATPITSPSPAPTTTDSAVAFGAYVAGAASDELAIDDFTELVGIKPSILMWYQSWESQYREFPLVTVKAADARGMRPIITWDPAAGELAASPACRLSSIWDGEHDAYVRKWAQAARDWGEPVYVRFGHEMNGDWKCWSVGLNGNIDGDFVRAWRYLVDVFRGEGASNVRWVWSPNVAYDERSARFDVFYPGDDFVDWVALDGYNWGPTREWHSWKTFTEIFADSYDSVATLSARPIMIGEVASTELGGNKAAWIESAFARELPERFPLVRAVVWFNENKETDWRVNSSAAALAAYRDAAENPNYEGSLP